MACKTKKAAVADALEDLSQQDFAKFCHKLLDRREEPRVRRSRVEGRSRWEVAEVLVSTFTEAIAVQVAAEVLGQIGCSDEAESLAEYNKEADGPKLGACDSVHFVDKHKVQLISRVSNLGPILDDLLDKNIIQQEVYDQIRALPTSQGKMRELYAGPLKAGGECKNVFYQILVTNEPYLIKDLEKNN